VYAIDQNKCTGCGRCQSVCPAEVDTIYLSPVRITRTVGKRQEEAIESSPDVSIPGAKNLPKIPAYYTQD